MSKEITDINSPEYWNQRYLKKLDHWDTGSTTPVFENLLKKNLIKNPGRIAILGCGKGYDAILFAQHDYLVTAIDFSPIALSETRMLARNSKVSLEMLQADLFELPGKMLHKYDYILEYVTYCAIDPLRRKEYLDNIQRLLKPGGILIGLFFPIDKREGGPPFSVEVDDIKTYLNKSFTLIYSEIPKTSIKPRLGKEILMLWKKKEV